MGFKRKDLNKCGNCGKGLMESGIPIFYKVRLESMGFDAGALQRADSLEKYFGGAGPGVAIANAMGPDEDLAQSMGNPVDVLICQPCAMEQLNILVLIEKANDAN